MKRIRDYATAAVLVALCMQIGYWAGTVLEHAVKVEAQTFPTFFARLLSGADPCMDPMVPKLSVAMNISSATTTQLVAVSGTTTVYACSWSYTAAGTSPSIQFESADTGGACANPVVLTGTFLPTVGQPVMDTDTGTIIKTPTGKALCALSAGTGPSIQGVLTYVQQ